MVRKREMKSHQEFREIAEKITVRTRKMIRNRLIAERKNQVAAASANEEK